jgi:hypothetical protein
MWLKNKSMITKNKNTRCAKQTWKWIFIMLTYANMNMKNHDKDKVQDYG